MKEANGGKNICYFSQSIYYILEKSKAGGFLKSSWVFRKGMKDGRVEGLKYEAQGLWGQRNSFADTVMMDELHLHQDP